MAVLLIDSEPEGEEEDDMLGCGVTKFAKTVETTKAGELVRSSMFRRGYTKELASHSQLRRKQVELVCNYSFETKH